MSWEADSRRTVLEGRQSLERTAQSLARAERVAVETETIGAGVVSELGEQRETLLRSKRRLEDTDDGLARSSNIVRRMACNVIANKLILVVIIVLELAILGTVVYLRFGRK